MAVQEVAGDARARRHAATRVAILDAAARMVAAEGLHELSMRRLAEAMGMRAPSLYEYVPSKQAIYDALFQRGWHALDRRTTEHAWPGTLRATLEAMLVDLLAFCAEDWARYQLMFTRAIPGWEPSDEAYAASRAAWDRMARVLAERGVEDPQEVELWAAVASGLVAQQFANDPDGRRYARLAAPAAAMFTHHHERNEP